MTIALFGFGGLPDETPDCLAVGSRSCPCGQVRVRDSAQPIVWVRCPRCEISCEITGGLPGFECIRCAGATELPDSFCETCGAEMTREAGDG